MKNLGLTLVMMLFIGVGTSMAQDKKAVDQDATAPVKTEMSAEKAHACSADCTKACCAKGGKASAKAEKKACSPSCEKKCSTADAGKAKVEEHENHDHDTENHPN